MPGTYERNTDGLINHAHHKSQKTAEKVDEVIQRLVKNKEKINFNSVSTESGVSKAYLYTHPDIRDRIETLRKQQEGLPSPKQVKREMTDASKDVVIAAKNKRIKELEEENRLLKQELQKVRGKMYDSLV
jgi:predicted Zn-dependent protease